MPGSLCFHSYRIVGIRPPFRISRVYTAHPAWGAHGYSRKVEAFEHRDGDGRKKYRDYRRVRSMAGRNRQLDAEGRSDSGPQIIYQTEARIHRAIERAWSIPRPRKAQPYSDPIATDHR